MSLEKQITQAWKYYKNRQQDCHSIAERVKNRKIMGQNFAFPEEIRKFDEYAKELRTVEGYITVRQKELNRRNPKLKKDNYAFNQQQVEKLKYELTNNP